MKEWDFKTNSIIELKSFSSRLHGDKDAFFDFKAMHEAFEVCEGAEKSFSPLHKWSAKDEGRLERIQPMTLTSSLKSDKKKLNYHFKLLVKQIESTFGFEMKSWE